MLHKISYPNYSDYFPVGPIADLKKWTEAFKNIYIKTKLGFKKDSATQEVIKDWPEIEQYNFKNWMKYYESGDQNKYKQAQSYYANDSLSYFLPNPPNKPAPTVSPVKSLENIEQEATQIAEATKPGLSPTDKQKLIEDHRRKLISRLNSVEKLLGSQQGHLFAGKDFEQLLHSIYELKKQIQTINKISLSNQTYIDLIIRQANRLQREGCKIASEFMSKFAQQTPGNGQAQFGEIPLSGSVPQGLGSLDNPPVNLKPVPAKMTDQETPKEGVDGFLDNLEGAGVTDGDNLKADDEIIVDEPDVFLDQEVGPKEELRVEAQMGEAEVKPTVVDPGETVPEKIITNKIEETKKETKNIDSILDSAFSQITPNDLLNKLQEISAVFQKKEILRQLSIADLMISSLSLSPYFPQFSELQQKNIDNLNYTNSRLIDIISTLQGSLGESTININPDANSINNPKSQQIQQHLKNQQQKERDRKELRKKVEDDQLIDKANKPEITVENPASDLNAGNPTIDKPVNSPAKSIIPQP